VANDRGFQSIMRPGGANEDDLLEALAAKKGIGRFQGPAEASGEKKTLASQGGVSEASEVASPQASRSRSAPRRRPFTPQEQQGPTPRDRMKSINLELPDYVMRTLKEMALEENCSVRHLIMRALSKDGIVVRPEDLVADGRRLRGKNAPKVD
jgi:hypothetical protein